MEKTETETRASVPILPSKAARTYRIAGKLLVAFEGGPIYRSLVLLGLFATIIGVWWQIFEWRATRDVWHQEAVARSWQILATPILGNGGKSEAMNFLASSGHSMAGLNLSCRAMAGIDENENCAGVHLSSLDFRNVSSLETYSNYYSGYEVDLRGFDLSGGFIFESFIVDTNLSRSGAGLHSNFSAGHIRNTVFQNVSADSIVFHKALIVDTEFIDVNLSKASFEGATIYGTFRDSRLELANFSDSTLHGVRFVNVLLEGSQFKNAHISGTIFENVNFSGLQASQNREPGSYHPGDFDPDTGAYLGPPQDVDSSGLIPHADFTGAWYTKGNPPQGLPSEILEKLEVR
jgi:uncharacterized protein YjbI with pentapeptide repeats